jgi:hypothetical protein
MEPLGSPIELEDYNQAAIILDIDGNGWSDRFARTSHFPSPILKQVWKTQTSLQRVGVLMRE